MSQLEGIETVLSLLNAGVPTVVLTGAGISVESGIPTFRGEEGYWREGSTVYTPMEMATFSMFSRAPERVWAWYRMRYRVCHAAAPNAGHNALRALGERFPNLTLVTQNVDGLHQRADFPPTRCFPIHGSIDRMRCSQGCPGVYHQPALVEGEESVDAAQYACTQCGAWMRPHILWFDETYSEKHYYAETALRLASEASLLLVIGTSGNTTLPHHIHQIVLQRGGTVLDINPERNPFSVQYSSHSFWWQTTATEGLRALLCNVE